ncbi:hypothetical protein [uncultured Pseudokineococcus sp.]|uniref:hypothetical protein n=1 Tax=uncultured Pseudokineococcus sp. TaxID=1642928 RepID=UPI002635261B|nr:hypothetical protein [uncultured Pseudokineococcus sp.]
MRTPFPSPAGAPTVLSRRALLTAGALAATTPALLATSAQAAPRSPFAGLGAWVDLYDWTPRRPAVTAATLDTMASAGVQTVYLQSSRPGSATLADPARLRSLVDRAHHRGMKVVLWYLPTHTDEERDARHLRAAAGEKVDGVGVDIESTAVRSVAERNRRVVRLVQRTRAVTTKPLVAITPSPTGLAQYAPKDWWPDYPFAAIRPHVDALATMTYWVYRKGKVEAGAYTASDVRLAREVSRDARLPVHVIGSPTTAADVRSMAKAVRATGAAGGSLYDWATTPSGLRTPLRDLRR